MARDGSRCGGSPDLGDESLRITDTVRNHDSQLLSFPISLPSCTVIVCTRRRPEELSRCLESLLQLRYPALSVLVIENDSAPAEAEIIAGRYGADYRLCTRRGLSAARNLGISIAGTDLVAFLDDDATADPNWLVNAVGAFHHPMVQAVTGKIRFLGPDGLSHEFDPGDHLVDRTTTDWFGMSNFGGLGLGSNFMVRRSAFDSLGTFDERLGRGAALHCSEENDLLFRILDAGYSVATRSNSVVYHPSARPQSKDESFLAIAASTVRAALLAGEHPRHLFKLAKYIAGAMTRKPQSWRDRPAHLFECGISRREVYAAMLAGPFIYLGATLRHLVYGTPMFQTPSAESLATDVTTSLPGAPERDLRSHIS